MTKRRKFLVFTGSAVSIGIAGCIGDTNGDDDPNGLEDENGDEDEQEDLDAAEEDDEKDPEEVVEEYIRATLNGDIEAQQTLLHEEATHIPSEEVVEDVTFDEFIRDINEISAREHLQGDQFDEFSDEEINEALQDFEQTTENTLNELGAEDYTLVRWEGTEVEPPNSEEEEGADFTEIELLVYDDRWLIYDRVVF